MKQRKVAILLISLGLLFTVGMYIYLGMEDESPKISDSNKIANSPQRIANIPEVNSSDKPTIIDKVKHETIQKKVIEESRFVKDEHSANDNEIILNNMYKSLVETNDPVEKRKIRNEISKIEPKDMVLDFLIDNYHQSNDEERLHIQSIITHMNPGSYVGKFFENASTTQDEALFVSYVYALRKANTTEAKKALLSLVENNTLTPNTESYHINTQAYESVNNALSDTVTNADAGWINEYIQSGVTDNQLRLIVKPIKEHLNEETISLLETVRNYAKSDELKQEVDELIKSYNNQDSR